jgi:hypothetical protein
MVSQPSLPLWKSRKTHYLPAFLLDLRGEQMIKLNISLLVRECCRWTVFENLAASFLLLAASQTGGISTLRQTGMTSTHPREKHAWPGPAWDGVG